MFSHTSNKDGNFWAHKFMDLANLELITLVFGQINAPKIHLQGVFVGITLYLLLVVMSLLLNNEL